MLGHFGIPLGLSWAILGFRRAALGLSRKATKAAQGLPGEAATTANRRPEGPLRLRRAAEEGRHNCPVQSTPRTKPMTDKATKLRCLDRSSTSLFKLSSRGGCREAHLDIPAGFAIHDYYRLRCNRSATKVVARSSSIVVSDELFRKPLPLFIIGGIV